MSEYQKFRSGIAVESRRAITGEGGRWSETRIKARREKSK
jgi:hypothetical protein